MTEATAVPEDVAAGSGADFFIARVSADTMRGERIRRGDYVVVERRDEAEDGEIVVALIDGENAIVMKFYREDEGRVRLEPANSALSPRHHESDRVSILGSVVGVIRKF